MASRIPTIAISFDFMVISHHLKSSTQQVLWCRSRPTN
jgi:hypothetical protein